MDDIRYKYALNENGDPVCIDNLSDGDRKNKKFICIYCNKELIPRLGDIRRHHFAHKDDCNDCNNESYLHKLAKKIFKNRFDTSSSLDIFYINKSKTDVTNNDKDKTSENPPCPFSVKKYDKDCEFETNCFNRFELCKSYYCRYFYFVKENLKEKYDICDEEKEMGGFRADLLLSSSINPEESKIMIEISVNHPCSENKKKLPCKIIEIFIKDEEDIKKLENCSLSQSEESSDTSLKIMFYNF